MSIKSNNNDFIDALKYWQSDLNGKNSNSYKFVLQLAILYYIKNDKYEISINDIFKKYVEIYWDNCVVYNFRESNDKKSVPALIQAIEGYATANSLAGIKYSNVLKRLGATNDKLVEEIKIILAKNNNVKKASGILKTILQNPISRLQHDTPVKNKSGGDAVGDGWLYKWNMNDQSLVISPSCAGVIKANIDIFRSLTYMVWTIFIEPFNLTPSLLSKLSRKKSSRSIPNKSKERIKAISDNECFYCGEHSNAFEYDHFIPFCYINHNEDWNLVLCCPTCNRGQNGKFEKLPRKDYIEKLIHRNMKADTLIKSYDSKKIHEVYKNCVKSGFREWESFTYSEA